MNLNLPPRTLQVWAILMTLTPRERRMRPQTAVAEQLGVTRQAICQQVRKLIKAGLAKKGRGNGLVVYRPRAGSTIHFHDEHTQCVDLPQDVKLHDWIALLTMTGASGGKLRRFPNLRCARLLVPPSGEQKDHSVKPSELKSLQKTADHFSTPTKKKPDAQDHHLMREYLARRRIADPVFKPSSKTWLHIRKARRELERRCIPAKKWGAYLDTIFEAFPKVTKGQCDIPPPAVIKSEFFVDRFLGNPDNRKIPAPRVHELLRREGFNDINPRVASMMLVDALRAGKVPRDIKPPYDKAVGWLLDHFDEVGYA